MKETLNYFLELMKKSYLIRDLTIAIKAKKYLFPALAAALLAGILYLIFWAILLVIPVESLSMTLALMKILGFGAAPVDVVLIWYLLRKFDAARLELRWHCSQCGEPLDNITFKFDAKEKKNNSYDRQVVTGSHYEIQVTGDNSYSAKRVLDKGYNHVHCGYEVKGALSANVVCKCCNHKFDIVIPKMKLSRVNDPEHIEDSKIIEELNNILEKNKAIDLENIAKVVM